MDFRGLDVGDFVYHCHIAEHEDHGMMAIIRVNPPSGAAQSKTSLDGGTDYTVTAVVATRSVR